MKYIKMLLLGFFGIIITVIGYDLVAAYTGYTYGLIMSFLGTIAGAHAILGYLGKERVSEANIEKLRKIGALFALLASVAPNLIFKFSSADLIFIGIAVWGGYEVPSILLARQLADDDPSLASQHKLKKPKKTHANIGTWVRLRIYIRKFMKIFIGHIPVIAVILVLGMTLTPGLGISWSILLFYLIYECWKSRIFIITDQDVAQITTKPVKSS